MPLCNFCSITIVFTIVKCSRARLSYYFAFVYDFAMQSYLDSNPYCFMIIRSEPVMSLFFLEVINVKLITSIPDVLSINDL